MRLTLERACIWLVLVALWAVIKGPTWLVLIGMGQVARLVESLGKVWRDLRDDFITTHEVTKL